MLSCKSKVANSIYTSTISNNIRDSIRAMFYMKLFKPSCANTIYFKNLVTKQYSHLYFINCKFVNNTNMPAMIYIMPTITSAHAGNILIQNSQFIKNKNIHLIEVKGETEIVPWQISTYIYFYSINVSLNEHRDGSSLISITMLHLSAVICDGYNVIAYNYVRYIMKATSGSYFIMKVGSTLSVINNTVYNIAKQVHTYEGGAQPVCPIQFYNSSHFYDDRPGIAN